MTTGTYFHSVPSLLELKFPELQGQGGFGLLTMAMMIGALVLLALLGVARGASENAAAAPAMGSVGIVVILVIAVVATAMVFSAPIG
jgi:hypothetical protein